MWQDLSRAIQKTTRKKEKKRRSICRQVSSTISFTVNPSNVTAKEKNNKKKHPTKEIEYKKTFAVVTSRTSSPSNCLEQILLSPSVDEFWKAFVFENDPKWKRKRRRKKIQGDLGTRGKKNEKSTSWVKSNKRFFTWEVDLYGKLAKSRPDEKIKGIQDPVDNAR